jgi:mono/diheme cytochrome c family protein
VAAAVPPTLLGATCKAGPLIAAGKPVTGLVSVNALTLTRGMVHAMFTSQLKAIAGVALVLVMLAGSVGLWAAQQTEPDNPPNLQAEQPPVPPANQPAPEPVAKNEPAAKLQAKDDVALIAHGAYLVNEVARCGTCHTRHLAKGGNLDMTRHLQGAELWFTTKVKFKGELKEHVPDITFSGKAGQWGEAKMIQFLSSGGKHNAPMPAYKLSVEDARAVTIYLLSLPGKASAATGKKKHDDDDH